ncbi:hypothetical protein GGI05_006941 [Coemansia sp. RSA 2603]|nr:hypothetical protein GGI05_006941 [Coemansia sp. RSA 2603]
MIAGREMALERIKADGKVGSDEANALCHKFVAYFSDQTHSSGQKAANIIGCRTRIIQSDKDFRLTKKSLMAAIEEDKSAGLVPFFVCGTFGTTNTTAIDDLVGIADVAESERLWYHVDAAYAGAALTCPEFRPLAAGIERADSFNFNAHKWMLTNFDCSAMWVADSKHLVNALSIHREYLPRVKGDTSFVKDYRDWQAPLGRRFRALKLWYVMRMFGASGIRAHIRNHVKQAKWLEEKLIEDGRFEIIAPVVFGLVVFRIKPNAVNTSRDSEEVDPDVVNKANTDLVKAIQADNRVFLVGTKIKGNDVVRAAIGSTIGKQEHVENLLEVVLQLTSNVIDAI